MSPRLSARPRVTTLKVDELLQRAQKGLLRLPAFQRPLRWKSSDFIDLFDSVYRGFPIGTLLLATQRWEHAETRFGPFVSLVAPSEPGYSIIDGQQRVTTLVGTLLHPQEAPAGDSYSIYFDLEDERFFHRARRTSVSETSLPLRVLRSLSSTLAWSRGWRLAAERPDLLERADQLAQSIREFEIAAAVVNGSDEQTLRDIFVRTNRAGVDLKASEVFEALHALTPEKSIGAATNRLASGGVGTVDGDFFLRCLLMVGELDPGSDLRRLHIEQRAVEETESAILAAAAFLRADCEVDEVESLPQIFPVLPLAGFFHRFPTAGDRARRLLRRWFWTGMRENEFSNNGFGAVRRWQGLLGSAATDDVVASSMLEAMPRATTGPELPSDWRNGQRALWIMQVALSARARLRPDWSFEGSFLGSSRHPGTWVPIVDASALASASTSELSSLGFSETSQRLLQEYLSAPSAPRLDVLSTQRLGELADTTREFLESVCEPGRSTRPTITTLLERARGAA
jgi:hypothetical protein